MTVGAILLAAGSARRMGEDKLLADLGGKPLVLHAFEAIEAARLDSPIVAVAPGSRIRALLEGRARLVEVTDHAEGMGHSLAAAVRKAPLSWTAAIVCLGDMPFIRPLTLVALAREAAAKVIVRPTSDGKPGNPVLWGCAHFNRLGKLIGDQGGRALFERYPVELLECGDPGILIDIDTPEALASARERLERP
jgi:CTP:molybdopterin cytidylyltransferase MocA